MVPSGNLLHSYWIWPIEIVVFPLKMVISIVFSMFTNWWPALWSPSIHSPSIRRSPSTEICTAFVQLLFWILKCQMWKTQGNSVQTTINALYTSSTAQGGGGSFKNRKPIGEIGCCESGMAERIHWWTERCLRSRLFLSLSLTTYMYLSIYLSIDLSISLFHLITYLPVYLSTYLPIYLST